MLNSKSKSNQFLNINKEIEIDFANIIAPLSENLKNFKLLGKIEKGKFTKISSKGNFGGNNFLDITMKKDKNNQRKYLEIYSDLTKPLLTEYNFFNGLWGFDWYDNIYDAYIYVFIAASWKQISANFIFFLAGLQNIQKSVIEASRIDCKSSFRRFWTITFPLLMPTTFFLIIINITYSFFDTLGIIDTTTIGAPSGETKTLVYKAYIDGFKGLDLGSAGAQSIIMMLIVLVITVFQFRFIEGKIHYN